MKNGVVWFSDQDLAERFSVSRRSIWRWSDSGDFPKPHKLSERVTRWKLEEIEEWERRKTCSST